MNERYNKHVLPLEKETVKDLDHALKCVRGLYYQNKIFEESGGKKGRRVEFDALSAEDKSAFIYLWTHGDQNVPLEIKEFVKIMKGDASFG